MAGAGSNFVVRGGADFSELRKALESTKKDLKTFQSNVSTGMKSAQTSMSGISKAVGTLKASFSSLAKAMGLVFGVAAIYNFGKASVQAASESESAWMGLKSIVEGYGKSFDTAKSYIESYISDGLVPATNAVTAYKNLVATGFDTSQIENIMEAFKNSAVYSRQSSYTIGEAIETATEGLKNQNSVVVDNVGVTKNLSVMLQEYAASLGKSTTALTEQEKLQAYYNGIMEATKFQMGDAASYMQTYAGKVSALSASFTALKTAVGSVLQYFLSYMIPVLNTVIQAVTKAVNAIRSLLGIKEISSSGVSVEGMSSGVEELADSAEDATDGLSDATKAAKALKNATTGIDELNVISDTASSSGSGGSSGSGAAGESLIDLTETDSAIESAAEAAANKISEIFQVFRDAWDSAKEYFLQGWNSALSNIKGLISDIGNTWADVWTNGTGQQFLEAILTTLGTIFDIIGSIATAFREAWDSKGEALITSYFNKLTSILNLINSIASAFKTAWDSGVGVSIMEHILSIATNLNNIVANLADRFREAWEANGNGVAIWTSILNIIDTVLAAVDSITLATANWAAGLDLEPLVSSFRTLLEAVEPLVAVITESLAAAYESVLLPLASWTIEEAVPAVLGLFASAISVLTEVLTALQPLGEWLWVNLLEPIATWTGGVIISVLEGLTNILNQFSAWISENQGAVTAITVAIAAFFAAWETAKLMAFIETSGGLASALSILAGKLAAVTIAKLADKAETVALTLMYAKDFVVSVVSGTAALVKQAAQWAITTALKVADTVAQTAMTAATVAWNAVCGIATTVTAAFGAAIAFLTSPIGLVIIAITAIIAIVALLITHWDEVKEAAGKAWDWIVEKWNAAGEWFNKTVIEPVAKFFSGLWEGVKSLASDAWNGIVSVWETVSGWIDTNVIQPVAGFFEGLWEGIVDAFTSARNTVEDIFNKLVDIVKAPINLIIGAINGLVSGVCTGINFIIDAVNGLSFDIPDWVPEFGGKTIGFNIANVTAPQIPLLAKGGIVDSATLAMVGEAGKEVVMPLENNTGWISELAGQINAQGGNEELLSKMDELVAAFRSGSTIKVDGKTLARSVNKSNSESGRSIFSNGVVFGIG